MAAGQFAERARVWINDQGPFEFTDRNVDNEFVYTYTIPSTATSISIRAEIYANGVWQIIQYRAQVILLEFFLYPFSFRWS